MTDDRFFPCNEREAFILSTLSSDTLAAYKEARHGGATVQEAVRAAAQPDTSETLALFRYEVERYDAEELDRNAALNKALKAPGQQPALDALGAWDTALERVQEAFYVLTSDRNSRDNCALPGIKKMQEWARDWKGAAK